MCISSSSHSELGATLGAGILAGASGSFVGHPFDSLKVRLQVGKTLERLKLDIFTVKQLYRGIMGPVLTSGLMSSMNFTMYECFKSEIRNRQNKDASPLHSVFWGACASGACLSVVASPIMLIKVQQQVASENNLWSTAKSLYKKRGLSTFYRGYGMTLILEAPGRGVYFLVYEYAKDVVAPVVSALSHNKQTSSSTHKPIDRDSNGVRMISAAIAGCMSWLVVYPFDVVRSRVLLDIDRVQFKNAAQCIMHSYREGGIRSFFKGIAYTMVRAAPVAATVMPVYELCKDFLTSV